MAGRLLNIFFLVFGYDLKFSPRRLRGMIYSWPIKHVISLTINNSVTLHYSKLGRIADPSSDATLTRLGIECDIDGRDQPFGRGISFEAEPTKIEWRIHGG